MTRGAYHPTRTPDGAVKRKDDGDDGRYLKRKQRDIPYYLRVDRCTFTCLEELLDVPKNRKAGTAIKGCTSRADVIEATFDVFDRVHALARELNIRDTDWLVTRMIEAVRIQERNASIPASLNAAPPLALPAPRNSNS